MTTPRGPVRDRAAEAVALRKVQRRVAAVGFFAVTIHGVFGTIGMAYVVDGKGRHGDAIALLVMSVVIALLSYGGVRLILGRRLWAPAWIVLALAPSVAGFVWIT